MCGCVPSVPMLSLDMGELYFIYRRVQTSVSACCMKEDCVLQFLELAVADDEPGVGEDDRLSDIQIAFGLTSVFRHQKCGE